MRGNQQGARCCRLHGGGGVRKRAKLNAHVPLKRAQACGQGVCHLGRSREQLPPSTHEHMCGVLQEGFIAWRLCACLLTQLCALTRYGPSGAPLYSHPVAEQAASAPCADCCFKYSGWLCITHVFPCQTCLWRAARRRPRCFPTSVSPADATSAAARFCVFRPAALVAAAVGTSAGTPAVGRTVRWPARAVSFRCCRCCKALLHTVLRRVALGQGEGACCA